VLLHTSNPVTPEPPRSMARLRGSGVATAVAKPFGGLSPAAAAFSVIADRNCALSRRLDIKGQWGCRVGPTSHRYERVWRWRERAAIGAEGKAKLAMTSGELPRPAPLIKCPGDRAKEALLP
jgi:hypothetical protein